MTRATTLKLGQVAGALFMAGGVAACQLRADPQAMSLAFIVGATLYGGCRLAAWMGRKD